MVLQHMLDWYTDHVTPAIYQNLMENYKSLLVVPATNTEILWLITVLSYAEFHNLFSDSFVRTFLQEKSQTPKVSDWKSYITLVSLCFKCSWIEQHEKVDINLNFCKRFLFHFVNKMISTQFDFVVWINV